MTKSIPQDFTIPERFMVWHSMPGLSHIGTWATQRFPEEAVEAVRADIHQAALDEVSRLNKWADSFSDAQQKERRLAEARIKELEATIAEAHKSGIKAAAKTLALLTLIDAPRPEKPSAQHWSDVCRGKNGGLKCDSADACIACKEEARTALFIEQEREP